jgi:hypothetical protein
MMACNQIPDVGITPAAAGLEPQSLSVCRLHQGLTWPGRFIARHRLVVAFEATIVGQSGAMLEQQPQGIRPPVQSIVKPQGPVTGQRQRCRRYQRLGKTPPRHDSFGAIIPDDAPCLDYCNLGHQSKARSAADIITSPPAITATSRIAV